jgi:hypothetical protein
MKVNDLENIVNEHDSQILLYSGSWGEGVSTIEIKFGGFFSMFTEYDCITRELDSQILAEYTVLTKIQELLAEICSGDKSSGNYFWNHLSNYTNALIQCDLTPKQILAEIRKEFR